MTGNIIVPILFFLSVTANQIWDLNFQGGPGGTDMRYMCAEQGYLVGLRAGVGSWIDSVQAICAKYDPKTGAMFGHQPEGPVFGGSGGGITEGESWDGRRKCEGNDVVYAFGVRETKGQRVLGQIILACLDSISKRRPTNAPEDQPFRTVIAGSGNLKYEGPTPGDSCAPGKAAVGIRVRAGAYVDAFTLVCAPLGWPAAPKMTTRSNGPGDTTFINPTERAPSGEIVLADSCLRPGERCGEPAAERVCKNNNLQFLVSFELGTRGARTLIPQPSHDQTICDGPQCVPLREVRCSSKDAGPAPSRGSAAAVRQDGGFAKASPTAPVEQGRVTPPPAGPSVPPPADASGGVLAGTGWDFTDYLAADFTGDGMTDLMVRKPNGDVLLVPFGGSTFFNGGGPIVAGNSWNFTHYWAADWTGDKRADVLARTQSGDVYFYAMQPNNTTYGGGPQKRAQGWNFSDYLQADFDGDGRQDLVGRTSSGDLVMLPLEPLLVPGVVGRGFIYTHCLAADFTGDGRADIIGRTAAGDLMLHTLDGTAFGPGARVGNGWKFTHYWPADWNGDGAADLIVRNENGDILLYTIKNGTFYQGSGPITLASGWNFTHYWPADFDGDGAADMMVRTQSGDLRFFRWKGQSPGQATGSDLRAVSTPSPDYPAEARRSRVSGEVLVEFTVNVDGSVRDARVVRGDPPRVFDRAAVEAVERWRFQPIAAPVRTRRNVVFEPEP